MRLDWHTLPRGKSSLNLNQNLNGLTFIFVYIYMFTDHSKHFTLQATFTFLHTLGMKLQEASTDAEHANSS